MLQNLLSKYKVILGSKSPRRQQFLKDLHIPFEIRTLNVEEIYPNTLKAEEITEYLAELKTKDIILTNNELLITSDTIVWLNNKPLEKPKNKEEAIVMLTNLSNNKHQVITSVCLKTTIKTKIFTDKTTVYFDVLDKDEIAFYIDTYTPFDKAGSYGIQEWIGLIGVTILEGSYANVVGLPVQKLYKELKNF